MSKVEILKWAGMEKETTDFALPLEWAKQVNKLEIDGPSNFVWHYPKGSISGRPLSLGDCLIKAINKGNLIPADILDNIIELAKTGKTNEEIKELVKMHCEML